MVNKNGGKEGEGESGIGQSRPKPSKKANERRDSGNEPVKTTKLPKHQGSDVVMFTDQGGERKKRSKKKQRKESGQRRYRKK